jgi:hypothetical protein
MTITTKYEIGQTVWFDDSGKPASGVVGYIQIEYDNSQRLRICYALYWKGHSSPILYEENLRAEPKPIPTACICGETAPAVLNGQTGWNECPRRGWN